MHPLCFAQGRRESSRGAVLIEGEVPSVGALALVDVPEPPEALEDVVGSGALGWGVGSSAAPN